MGLFTKCLGIHKKGSCFGMNATKNEVKVSIYCMTYNHGKYIRDALEGFVMQKTNFRFEVIVHDDASTDGTTDIIREYEEKYPDIIKPIYQTENQYSKNIRITNTYIYPKLKGKYVAVCEGDDYWIDENKLQIQYDIMEQNPQCSICTHSTRWIDMKVNKTGGFFPNKSYNIKEGVIDKKLQLEISLFDLFHLTSCFFRKEYYDKYMLNSPEFAKMFPVGDVPLLLYFAKIGNMFYIDKEMSVYRRGTEGSWTARVVRNKDKTRALKHNEKCLSAMDLCKDFFDDREVDSMFEKAIKMYKFNIAMLNKDYDYILSSENKEMLIKCKKRTIVKFHISKYFPYFDDIWQAIKEMRVKIVNFHKSKRNINGN